MTPTMLQFGLVAMIAATAFFPSYFLPLITDARRLAWPIHFHALTMTAWCALMVAQAYAVKTQRLAAHRRLIRCSYYLAPGLILAAVNITRWSALNHMGMAPRSHVLAVTLDALTDIAVFAFFYALALRDRNNLDRLSRFLLAASVALLPPTFERIISWIPPLRWMIALRIGLVAVDLWFMALIARDILKHRTSLVYPSSLTAYVLIQCARPIFQISEAWQHLAARILSL